MLKKMPTILKSNYAVTWLYFYDHKVIDITNSIEPYVSGGSGSTGVNLANIHRNMPPVELLSGRAA